VCGQRLRAASGFEVNRDDLHPAGELVSKALDLHLALEVGRVRRLSLVPVDMIEKSTVPSLTDMRCHSRHHAGSEPLERRSKTLLVRDSLHPVPTAATSRQVTTSRTSMSDISYECIEDRTLPLPGLLQPPPLPRAKALGIASAIATKPRVRGRE
jgi:hypothetical protein